MVLHEFLRTRRSIRQFTAEPVPIAEVERILTTATSAPSAHNRQPWRFAVVTSAHARAALADNMTARFRQDLEKDRLPAAEVEARVEISRSRVQTAPVVIVMCMDAADMDSYPDAARTLAERTMAIQSVSNAGMALLYAAHADGLGGVWNCAPLFAPDIVRNILDLPTSWEPQAMFLLGKPARTPGPGTRKPLTDVTLFR